MCHRCLCLCHHCAGKAVTVRMTPVKEDGLEKKTQTPPLLPKMGKENDADAGERGRTDTGGLCAPLPSSSEWVAVGSLARKSAGRKYTQEIYWIPFTFLL